MIPDLLLIQALSFPVFPKVAAIRRLNPYPGLYFVVGEKSKNQIETGEETHSGN